MKKDCFKNFMSGQFIMKMILMLLAVVTGGGVLAIAYTAEPMFGISINCFTFRKK